jgi:hypothetical protein
LLRTTLTVSAVIRDAVVNANCARARRGADKWT